jgi:Tol biopolymer transport system component
MRLGRDVAIKVLPEELARDPERLRRFEGEARAASALSDPHIVTVFDVGEENGVHFFATELVEGSDLRHLLDGGALPLKKVLDLAEQIASGLAAAHEKGIVHRDLKPENILITKAGLAKIADFGLAKLTESTGASVSQLPTTDGHQTSAGVVMGTITYMSPEQVKGLAVDHRSDIFSFGVVLYEMLTGRKAFQRATAAETMAAILKEEPFDLSETGGNSIPPALARVMAHCLEKMPEQRFHSMNEALYAVQEIKYQSTASMPQLPPARVTRPWLIAGIAFAVAVALLALGGLWLSRRGRHAVPLTTRWERLTNFTDSVTSPALSPDGRLLTFIRGVDTFTGPGQVYVKLLPDGEPIRLTDDTLEKMSPVFSPEGTRIAYTASPWDAWIVPVLGGKPRLWLPNASGLTWIDRDRVLFSEIKRGIHMGLVTAAESRAEARDVYVPTNELGMAHRSYLSPDHKWVLTAEMTATGWLPCRILPFEGNSPGKAIGPRGGRCTSGAWSPDGSWTYSTVDTGDGFHIWRQRFPGGQPEQVTSGPTQQEGVAMAADGRSFITSVGVVQSAIWIHDARGDRQVSGEGFAGFGLGGSPRSYFSADGKKVYCLVRGESARAFDEGELTALDLETGRAERLLPGFEITNFDLSTDGSRVIFSALDPAGRNRVWLGSLQNRFSPRRISSVPDVEERRPVFGPADEVFYVETDARTRRVVRWKSAGGERLEHEMNANLATVSPDGAWLVLRSLAVSGEEAGGSLPLDAYPAAGGAPVRICPGCRRAQWSADGRFFLISYTGMGILAAGGKTFVIPIARGRSLPDLPAHGIGSETEAGALPGAQVIDHGEVSPGPTPSIYAFVKVTAQRNLYRVPIHD